MGQASNHFLNLYLIASELQAWKDLFVFKSPNWLPQLKRMDPQRIIFPLSYVKEIIIIY